MNEREFRGRYLNFLEIYISKKICKNTDNII